MRFRLLTFFVLTPCLVLLMTSQSVCDVSPGDVLDKTKWEKAEGLLPGEIIGWIKKGDFVVQVGELNYKLRDYLPPHALRASRENVGKYVLDEDDWIVEKETGKRGKHILGHPFPQIDPEGPKASEKMVYNTFYTGHVGGSFIAYLRVDYLRRSGYIRTTHGENHTSQSFRPRPFLEPTEGISERLFPTRFEYLPVRKGYTIEIPSEDAVAGRPKCPPISHHKFNYASHSELCFVVLDPSSVEA